MEFANCILYNWVLFRFVNSFNCSFNRDVTDRVSEYPFLYLSFSIIFTFSSETVLSPFFGYFNVEIYPKVIAMKDLKLPADLLNGHNVVADYVRANLLKSRVKA